MLSRLPRYFKDNLVGFLALFVALGGTSAYAVNTINSTDIVDGQVKSADIGDGEVGSADVKDNWINTFDLADNVGVHGADVIDGTITGADVLNGSLNALDIANNGVDSLNIANNDVQSQDIANGFLNDEDVGQSVSVDFAGTIGTVNANSCVNRIVTGLGALGDHLLLTPSVNDANGALMYDAKYTVLDDTVTIHVCNFSNANIDDGTTHFNLLVFDAQ